MAFTKKLLELAVQLAPNTQTNQPNQFAETGSDTVTISGARMSVRIQNSGAPSNAGAQIAVYGLKQSLMDQLSTLGMQLNVVPKNTLTVTAGDEERGLTAVFSGTIVNAYADYNAMPDVPFRFICQSGLAQATAPATATSYNGSTDVATIMSGLARQMNLGFENNGVNANLSNPYLSGSLLTQMRTVAEHANINAEIVNGNVLAIWPKFGYRTSNTQMPLIAAPPEGTMIGYPSFTQQGIMVRDLFNPQVAFGGRVKVKSQVQKANGIWAVHKLDLALDSQVPRGEWLAMIYGYSPDAPNPVIPPQ